jgi:hypothetical protein
MRKCGAAKPTEVVSIVSFVFWIIQVLDPVWYIAGLLQASLADVLRW